MDVLITMFDHFYTGKHGITGVGMICLIGGQILKSRFDNDKMA
jgi:hypothetical protein